MRKCKHKTIDLSLIKAIEQIDLDRDKIRRERLSEAIREKVMRIVPHPTPSEYRYINTTPPTPSVVLKPDYLSSGIDL